MAHIPSPATGGYFPPSANQTHHQHNPAYAGEVEDDEDEEGDTYTPAPKRGGFQRKGSCWPKATADIR